MPVEFALRKTDGTTVVPRSSQTSDNDQWWGGLERFLDEARTLSRFKHDQNIVRIENRLLTVFI
ncbi:MAG: hypothetical protein ACXW00_05400 [Methylobacter sp.]